jgi:hypothetical protein
MAPVSDYRRKAPRRIDVLIILENQGADLTPLILPKGALSERQIWNYIEAQGVGIPCGHCKETISRRCDCIRDHRISLKSVAADKQAEHDQHWNQWYLCLSCNSTKTHKRGLAGLGSDAARIAKYRRVGKVKAKCRARSIPSKPFPKPLKKPDLEVESKGSTWAKPSIPGRPFPAAQRRLSSRPFAKRQSPQGAK